MGETVPFCSLSRKTEFQCSPELSLMPQVFCPEDKLLCKLHWTVLVRSSSLSESLPVCSDTGMMLNVSVGFKTNQIFSSQPQPSPAQPHSQAEPAAGDGRCQNLPAQRGADGNRAERRYSSQPGNFYQCCTHTCVSTSHRMHSLYQT